MMKKTGLTVSFVVLFLLASCLVDVKPLLATPETENTWTTKTPMPEAASGIKAAVVNGKIYVMSGSFNYEYDPATDNWTAKTPMPTLRRSGSFGIAACQNKIYVIGGDNGTGGHTHYLSTNEVYDPSTDSWETKKPMPTSREGIDANVIDDKIFVIGGRTDNYRSIQTAVNECYDPATDSWTTKQQAPIAVMNYASAVVDNKIYIIGGLSDGSDPLNALHNQIYDAETDTWSFGAPLPTATWFAAVGATTGVLAPKRIYVVGGGFENTSNAVLVYNPSLDAWSYGAPMPTNRTGLAVAVVNDVIYAIGGNLGLQSGYWPFWGTSLTTNVLEQYTPLGYGTIPSVTTTELFPLLLVAGAIGAITGIALLFYYYKKRNH